MKKILDIDSVYVYKLTNAHASSYHKHVYEIISRSSLFLEPDIQSLIALYHQLILEMDDCVGISRKLDTTATVLSRWKAVKNAFRLLFNDLKNLRYNENEALTKKFDSFEKTTFLEVSLAVERKPMSERIATLMSFVSHLRSDWMELIEAAGLTERLEMLESALEKHNEMYVLHIEEMAAVDKGRVKRVRKELENLYQVLMFYVQAWANTPDEGESPENVAKFEAARDVVSRVNKLISDLNKSLSVAKSNRRRAKKKAEAEGDEISHETEIEAEL